MHPKTAAVLCLSILLAACGQGTPQKKAASAASAASAPAAAASPAADADFMGMKVGRTTLAEAQKILPAMKPAEQGTITIGKHQIPMDTHALMPSSDGENVIFSFDGSSKVLQQIMRLSPEPFAEIRTRLENKYSAHTMTRQEFDMMSTGKNTYEEHIAALKQSADKVAVFKQGNVLIIGSADTPARSLVIYLNTEYMPVALAKVQ